jgi:hypothetical protein
MSAAADHDTPARWRARLPALGIPAAALAALPACPACYPLYAGALAALGLGALADPRAQTLLTFAFLTVALGALALRARARRGYGPLALGAAASAAVLAGKLALASNPVTYAGVGALVAASLWNLRPGTGAGSDCPRCAGEAGASPAGAPAP